MKDSNSLAIIILAAGKGSRMKSTLPKVLHKIAGRPILSWLIHHCESLNPDKLIIVTAPDMDDVAKISAPHIVAFQTEQKGTGDAVKAALPALEGFNGRVLILCGDEPFIDVDVIKDMIDSEGLTAMSVSLDNPAGLGRMILDKDNYLESIVEDKDCTPEQRKIQLANAGNYCLDSDRLEGWLNQIGNDNAQQEYYLTDIPQIAKKDGVKTKVFNVTSQAGWGINTRIELAVHEAYAQKLLRQAAMLSGVTFIDPDSVTLSYDTSFGQDVTVEPNVYFGKNVVIEDGVTIHAFSHIDGAHISKDAEIGPYARIRPQSEIGEGASVGNFIEVNRSVIEARAKAKHMSYLGDSIIGSRTNIGAGTVIANYDGFFKHQSKIGKNVFIGSNSTIISPVKIGDGAIVAAGSNINKDITQNAMAIGRSRQENHDGWATQYRHIKQEQKAHEEED